MNFLITLVGLFLTGHTLITALSRWSFSILYKYSYIIIIQIQKACTLRKLYINKTFWKDKQY